MRSRSGAGASLLLAAGSTLFALLALEAGFRVRAVLQKRPVPVSEATWTEYDPVRGWRHIAGKVASRAYASGPVIIDRDGFRVDAADTATAAASGPRPRRTIYAVGDSFTFGHKVTAHDAWPACLGRLLADCDLRVVNMGACAYGVDQMYLWLREIKERIEPGDVVIVGVIAADLRRITMPRWISGHARPLFRLDGSELKLTNVPVPKMLAAGSFDLGILFTTRQSYLRDFVVERLKVLGSREAATSVRLGARLVEAMRDVAAERGAGFLVATLPMMDRSRADEFGTMDLLARAAAEAGIPIVDCRDGFPPNDPVFFFKDDGHPTPAGHEAIAERIGAEVRTRFPALAAAGRN